MPTITLDKKDLMKLLGRTIPDEKLKDRISMLGTDLEKVTSNEIEVEIFPNRPDMLSAEGFARALSSFIGIKKGLREYKVNKSIYKSKKDKKVSSVRPYHQQLADPRGTGFHVGGRENTPEDPGTGLLPVVAC